MTGLGDEVVTRCPTCGYGLTARRYAVPKDCPICHNSFEQPAAPQSEKDTTHSAAHDSHSAASDGAPGQVESAASAAAGVGETTLHIQPAAVTSPLGEATQRMPEPESKGAQDAPPPEEPATPRAEGTATQDPQAVEQEQRREEPPPRHPFETRMFTPPPEPRKVEPLPPTHAPQPAYAAHAPSAFVKEVAPRVMNRYTDAYRVARTTVIVGNVLKVLGVVAGLVIGLTLFAVFAGQSRFNPQFGVTGVVMGLLFGGGAFAFLFVLGVVISAQGQLMKATLDGAVNGSPFLSDEQRAEVMSVRY